MGILIMGLRSTMARRITEGLIFSSTSVRAIIIGIGNAQPRTPCSDNEPRVFTTFVPLLSFFSLAIHCPCEAEINA
jgi:hypothetical protein